MITWVLQYDKLEFLLWGNHDLVLLGSDSNEVNILVWQQRLDGKMSLGSELVYEGAIFDGVVLGHGRLDGDSLRIDNHYTLYDITLITCSKKIY